MTAKHMPERHASDILKQTFINRIFAIAFQSEHKKIHSVTTIPKHIPIISLEITFFKLTEFLNSDSIELPKHPLSNLNFRMNLIVSASHSCATVVLGKNFLYYIFHKFVHNG